MKWPAVFWSAPATVGDLFADLDGDARLYAALQAQCDGEMYRSSVLSGLDRPAPPPDFERVMALLERITGIKPSTIRIDGKLRRDLFDLLWKSHKVGNHRAKNR